MHFFSHVAVVILTFAVFYFDASAVLALKTIKKYPGHRKNAPVGTELRVTK